MEEKKLNLEFRGKRIEGDQEWVSGCGYIKYPNGAFVIIDFDNEGNELSFDVYPQTLSIITSID